MRLIPCAHPNRHYQSIWNERTFMMDRDRYMPNSLTDTVAEAIAVRKTLNHSEFSNGINMSSINVVHTTASSQSKASMKKQYLNSCYKECNSWRQVSVLTWSHYIGLHKRSPWHDGRQNHPENFISVVDTTHIRAYDMAAGKQERTISDFLIVLCLLMA